jgi:putative addiction module component (TIGR02574 family)
MSEHARKLLASALALPAAERAELITQLLASLDAESPEAVEEAWNREVERRARAAYESPDDDVAWEDVRAELHSR